MTAYFKKICQNSDRNNSVETYCKFKESEVRHVQNTVRRLHASKLAFVLLIKIQFIKHVFAFHYLKYFKNTSNRLL